MKIDGNISFRQNILQEKLNQKAERTKNTEKKSDIFEIINTKEKKNNNKKNIILAISVTGIIATIVFFKRKDIKNLFIKNNEKIRDSVRTNSSKEVIKDKVMEETSKIKDEISLTAEEATKILKNGPNDNAKIIKALEYVTEHGTDKKELPFFYLDNDMDDIAISAVRFFERQGSKKDAALVMSPITGKEYISLNDRGNLYKETLKTVQKLADLTSYSEQDRIDIFYEPIENLLNHSDKEVRELAQETLEKITPKK